MFAEILLDNAIDRPLDYFVPPVLEATLKPGTRVKVPLRKSHRFGTVLALKSDSAFPNASPILELVAETPYISPELFKLAEWMAQYYCTPLRKTLQVMLPASIRGQVNHKEQYLVSSDLSAQQLQGHCETLRRTYPLQANVLDLLLKHPKGLLLSKLLETDAISSSAVQTLIKKKLLKKTTVQIDRSLLDDYEYFPTQPKKLNAEQAEALSQITASIDQNHFSPYLLFGVTGSGKTEIYLQAITHTLQLKRGVIFLVPEIALTSQTVERLRSRFQEKIVLLHHRLSEGEKHDAWHHIRSGRAPIVIGARSAIFCPMPHLGLIIVDEEQEAAYKQGEESPSYNARDIAVMRAKFCQATVILGSATPSFESYYNAKMGKYTLLSLNERADAASLPTTEIIDMQEESRKTKQFTLFSERLIHEIKQRLSVGEQTILFLNRRGYHTAQLCSQCHHSIKCPECEVPLTFHLSDKVLACHLCDHRLSPPPRQCPQCHSDQGLKFKGAGTEMVERALHALLPEVRTLRLDADTTRHKGSHELLFKQFRAGKADILIGTQMIAKGLHFPSVTLVGILNADAHLQIPDFRASEQVFQLITQVAGRAGRGLLPGRVILQTRLKEHPVITLAAAQNYDPFFNQEIALRELFKYPPLTRLIKLVFTGKEESLCRDTAESWRTALAAKAPSHCEFLPIVPCGHAKIKGAYRFQCLIKGKSTRPLLPLIHALRAQVEKKKGVQVFVDIDPLSTFF